jgi:hypothetical protein
MPRGNPDNLRAAAHRKSQATAKRAETALRRMIKNGAPITFRGVARTAGCSIDFLTTTRSCAAESSTCAPSRRNSPRRRTPISRPRAATSPAR